MNSFLRATRRGNGTSPSDEMSRSDACTPLPGSRCCETNVATARAIARATGDATCGDRETSTRSGTSAGAGGRATRIGSTCTATASRCATGTDTTCSNTACADASGAQRRRVR